MTCKLVGCFSTSTFLLEEHLAIKLCSLIGDTQGFWAKFQWTMIQKLLLRKKKLNIFLCLKQSILICVRKALPTKLHHQINRMVRYAIAMAKWWDLRFQDLISPCCLLFSCPPIPSNPIQPSQSTWQYQRLTLGY